MCCLLNPSIASVQSLTDEPSKDFLIQSAIFADSKIVGDNERYLYRGIGLISKTSGNGIIYQHFIQNNMRPWTYLFYGQKHPNFLLDITKSEKIGYIQSEITNQYEFMMGIDMNYQPFSTQTWRFIYGIGAGVNQTRYSTMYYKKFCTFYCGYTLRNPIEINETDTYAKIIGRIGIGFFDTQIWNLKGDVKFILDTPLKRTGEFYLLGPGGEINNNFLNASFNIEGFVAF